MNPGNRLAPLKRVRFHPPAATSPLLSGVGVTHGFTGVGQSPPAVHVAKQVHGVRFITASGEAPAPGGTRPEADGLFTTVKGTRIAVKTADCLPLLFVDEGQRVAGAVHAGWRGLTAGIVGSATLRAAELGIAANHLLFAIGPAIGRERYEVGDEVIEALFGPALGLSATDASLCIAKGKGEKWHVDLQLAAVLTLLQHGVIPEHISAMQACTFSLSAWHSFRREGQGFGSNWSWIQL